MPLVLGLREIDTNEYSCCCQSAQATRRFLYLGCCLHIPDHLRRVCADLLLEDAIRHSRAHFASAPPRTDFYALVRAVFHSSAPCGSAPRRSASQTGCFGSGDGSACCLRGYCGCVSCGEATLSDEPSFIDGPERSPSRSGLRE